MIGHNPMSQFKCCVDHGVWLKLWHRWIDIRAISLKLAQLWHNNSEKAAQLATDTKADGSACCPRLSLWLKLLPPGFWTPSGYSVVKTTSPTGWPADQASRISAVSTFYILRVVEIALCCSPLAPAENVCRQGCLEKS
jgi:hypothetical protein